jgi:hypothetical protein
MSAEESPGAVAADGALEADRLGRVSKNKLLQNPSQAPIPATLIGSDRCSAEGISVRGYAPVLSLCRALIEAVRRAPSPMDRTTSASTPPRWAWSASAESMRGRWRTSRAIFRHNTIEISGPHRQARLRLSHEERTRMGITTIGAYDVDKREREKRHKFRKRTRDRERAARKRAARGVMPREKYLAVSLSKTQPWKAKGISRRTWERRRRAALHDLTQRKAA